MFERRVLPHHGRPYQFNSGRGHSGSSSHWLIRPVRARIPPGFLVTPRALKALESHFLPKLEQMLDRTYMRLYNDRNRTYMLLQRFGC